MTLIVFDDMIADMLSNKKFNPILTDLFITRRKLNISIVFTTQLYTLFCYENSKQARTSINCI